MTVVWHVDDNFKLTKFSCYLAKIYGSKLNMHLGRKHDYLGVDMERLEDGTLEVSMFKYLRIIISEFPKKITR